MKDFLQQQINKGDVISFTYSYSKILNLGLVYATEETEQPSWIRVYIPRLKYGLCDKKTGHYHVTPKLDKKMLRANKEKNIVKLKIEDINLKEYCFGYETDARFRFIGMEQLNPLFMDAYNQLNKK